VWGKGFGNGKRKEGGRTGAKKFAHLGMNWGYNSIDDDAGGETDH